MRPTPNDIATAIDRIRHHLWVDPIETPNVWLAVLYDSVGNDLGDGWGETPGLAAALAWVNCWAPDALATDGDGLEDVPLAIPDGYQFVLTPPLPRE